jgi:hemolysin-activating ACP:hemolysin acyltransferase
MIGDVIELMLKSDMHRDWYIADLERLVVPAIEANKMTVVYENK